MLLNIKETFLSLFHNDPLFQKAYIVLNHLERAGFEAFLVGGCVRNVLLQKHVHDIDIATSALPHEVVQLFPKVYKTGIKYGTVSVIIEQTPIEVTTYRSEKNYRDGRRPEQIDFVKRIDEDLARRDFTINAIACDRHGNVFDPFGGQVDLTEKTVQAVGTATERFQEDALRMLRAIRIAAQLGFTIAHETLSAIKQERKRLEKLAIERVKHELDQLLLAVNPSIGITYLWSTGLIHHIAPLKPTTRQVSLDESTLHTIDRETDVSLRWILFLKLSGVNCETARTVMNRFKMSRVEKDEYLILWEGAVNTNFRQLSWHELKQTVFEVGMARLIKMVRLAVYFNQLPKSQQIHINQRICHADWELPLEHISQLAIDGSMLMRMAHKKPGAWISDVKRSLLTKVINGEVTNHPGQLEREWRTDGPYAP